MKKYERIELKNFLKAFVISEIHDVENNAIKSILFVVINSVVILQFIFNLKQSLLYTIVTFGILVPLGIYIFCKVQYKEYYKSEYYKVTKHSLLFTYSTVGNYGEYETYLELRDIDNQSKFLFNIYIPTNNENTTEIDLVMINKFGVYIIESKNISGRVYGSENDFFWTIVYKDGRKYTRYMNPINQNKKHTNAIISMFPNINSIIYKQYVVLSKRCTIGKMNITTPYIHVIKRSHLVTLIKKEQENSKEILSQSEINAIYSELKKYQNPPKEIVKKHDKYLQDLINNYNSK